MNLSDFVNCTRGELIGGDTPIQEWNTDTRNLASGDVFIALKGKNFDGHQFIENAIKKGACGVVVEKNINNLAKPQLIVADTTKAIGNIARYLRVGFPGKVIAITGSCGKTTVKEMVAAICSHVGSILATQGSLNNHIGVPITLMKIKPHHRYAVIEAGTSNKGEIGYLAEIIQPDVALVNNIMPAHVLGFGNVAAIAEEKADLYRHSRGNTIAIINLESEFAQSFINKTATQRQIGFARESKLTRGHIEHIPEEIVLIKNIEDSRDNTTGMNFKLQAASETISVILKVPGEQNVLNAAAAAACALAVGIQLPSIKAGLESFNGVKGRMQLHALRNGVTVIDDSYNASPGSAKAAIDYLKKFANSVLVLGDMGELGSIAEQEHFGIGRYAKDAGIKALFSVGMYAENTVKGFGNDGYYYQSKEELIQEIKKIIVDDMAILVKGSRSTKMEEVVEVLRQHGVP